MAVETASIRTMIHVADDEREREKVLFYASKARVWAYGISLHLRGESKVQAGRPFYLTVVRLFIQINTRT